MDVQRPIPAPLAGNLGLSSDLRDELASKADDIGAKCLYIRPGIDPADLTLEFDVAPNDAALDAAIAAYPSIAPPESGTVVVADDTAYKIHEEAIAVGQHIVFDVHVLAALGDVSSSQPGYIDAYPVVWRNTNGVVKVIRGRLDVGGNIPGLTLLVSSTATTAVFEIKTRKAGSLHLLEVDVTRKMQGSI